MLQATFLKEAGKVLLLANREPDVEIRGGKVVKRKYESKEDFDNRDNEEKVVSGINPKYIQGNRKYSQEEQTKKALADLKSIGTERIKKITCMCCEKTFGDHSHKDLLRCVQLLQNTNCAWGYELAEYKAIEKMQIEELRSKQTSEMQEDKGDMENPEWKDVDMSQEGEKEMLDKIKGDMDSHESNIEKIDMDELDEKGSTMFETQDEQGRPITVEAIDPESDLGKKILKEEREKKKHGKSN